MVIVAIEKWLLRPLFPPEPHREIVASSLLLCLIIMISIITIFVTIAAGCGDAAVDAAARLRSAARASARAARVSLVVSQAAIHVSELNYQQASGAYI